MTCVVLYRFLHLLNLGPTLLLTQMDVTEVARYIADLKGEGHRTAGELMEARSMLSLTYEQVGYMRRLHTCVLVC